MVRRPKCHGSVGAAVFRTAALKIQIFSFTSGSPTLIVFMVSKHQGGTRGPYSCREESPHGKLPRASAGPRRAPSMGQSAFHSPPQSSEHLQDFAARSAVTSDDPRRLGVQGGADGAQV